MILIDTSVLVDALTEPAPLGPALQTILDRGELLSLSVLVLFEWRRGPRNPRELAVQEVLLPSERALPFGPIEATRAAELYRMVRNPRRREFDIALAACALEWDARIWTLNPTDFRDIPGLKLFNPSAK